MTNDMNANQQNRTAVLIVAAGRGHRFGGPLPKQYADLAGHAVLYHTVAAVLAHPAVDVVRCVIHSDDRALYDAAVDGLDVLDPVVGGAERQDSVRLGLESLEDLSVDTVLIHDAARPFVDSGTIDGVLAALANHPGAIPAVAVADTLKRGQDGVIADTVPRDDLFRAQTPQGFRLAQILAAHQSPDAADFTDDAQLYESLGLSVALTDGHEDNFKITRGEDLMRAERLLAGTFDTRTATGYDAHKFADGTFVTLGGVEIPHSHGLAGHSDADVALHALTDALLGTIGAGDIGQHFPPSDPQWKGASSDRFVQHAAKLIRDRGGEIVNLDVTIICESPKIGPHASAMKARVAEVLAIDADRVSVKATTTEGMGFTGRREGIAAQALAAVRVPI